MTDIQGSNNNEKIPEDDIGELPDSAAIKKKNKFSLPKQPGPTNNENLQEDENTSEKEDTKKSRKTSTWAKLKFGSFRKGTPSNLNSITPSSSVTEEDIASIESDDAIAIVTPKTPKRTKIPTQFFENLAHENDENARKSSIGSSASEKNYEFKNSSDIKDEIIELEEPKNEPQPEVKSAKDLKKEKKSQRKRN